MLPVLGLLHVPSVSSKSLAQHNPQLEARVTALVNAWERNGLMGRTQAHQFGGRSCHLHLQQLCLRHPELVVLRLLNLHLSQEPPLFRPECLP